MIDYDEFVAVGTAGEIWTSEVEHCSKTVNKYRTNCDKIQKDSSKKRIDF